MIERYEGQMELICDDCEAAFPQLADEDQFDILMADAKHCGWRTYKNATGWAHACPACVRILLIRRKDCFDVASK